MLEIHSLVNDASDYSVESEVFEYGITIFSIFFLVIYKVTADKTYLSVLSQSHSLV